MKIAYLDCFSGVSGDMLLGAFVACGVEMAELEEPIRQLHLGDIRWQQESVKRAALLATQVRIEADAKQPRRDYRQIVELLGAAPLSPRVQQEALSIFKRLGEAEAAVHGCELEHVHFHEIGAVDSIADIVGSCLALEKLGIEELHCSPLNVGGGTVACDHGVLPVPAPATVALLRGIPVYSSGIAAELVTPTGAAIVSTLAKGFGPLPAMRIEAVGYGAGARNHKEMPNVLRVLIGQAAAGAVGLESLLMLEANLDDMNPQLCGFFAERAFAAGALDVFLTPVQMKKGRPGILLSVLCRPELRDPLTELFFQETTTLGVRSSEVLRRALEREWVPVATPYGEVRIKVSRQNGRIINYSPEFEDCRRLATRSAIPLRKIWQEATSVFLQEFGSQT